MLVNKKQFIEEIKDVINAAGKGAQNPDNSLSFSKAKDRHFISTSNDFISIIRKSSIAFEDNFSVRLEELYNVLKNVSADEVELNYTGSSLSLETATSTTHVKTLPTINYFAQNVVIGGEWNKLPSDFFEKAELCSKVVAKDAFISELLKYVYVDGNTMVGADGNQLFHAKLNGEVNKLFLHGAYVKELAKLKLTHYVVRDGWIQFCKDSNLLYAVRTIHDSERYPFIVTKSDYSEEELSRRASLMVENIIKVKGTEMEFSDKKEMLKAVESCLAFTKNEKDNILSIHITNDTLIIEGSGAYGSHSQRFPITSDREFSFKIHPYILASVLRGDCSKVSVNDNALYIVSDFGTHVISLIKG